MNKKFKEKIEDLNFLSNFCEIISDILFDHQMDKANTEFIDINIYQKAKIDKKLIEEYNSFTEDPAKQIEIYGKSGCLFN